MEWGDEYESGQEEEEHDEDHDGEEDEAFCPPCCDPPTPAKVDLGVFYRRGRSSSPNRFTAPSFQNKAGGDPRSVDNWGSVSNVDSEVAGSLEKIAAQMEKQNAKGKVVAYFRFSDWPSKPDFNEWKHAFLRGVANESGQATKA